MNPVRYLDTSTLYCGDNLDRLREFPDECVDLIYLDPPFFSNKTYEVIWGDEAEVRSFKDRWEGGIKHYIGWMTHRLREMHRILKPTGALYLHCDPAASHYLKVKLDEPALFGASNFRNEIVWRRTSAHNDAQRFGRIHDVLLYYAKDAKQVKFNRLYRPYDQSYLDAEWRHDETGRRFKLENLTAPLRGDTGRFEFHGRTPGQTRMWRFSRERMDALWDAGLIRTDKHGVPLLRGHVTYLDDMPGVPLQDWWEDILRVGNTSKERIGYPTQKPEALLQRIIESSTDPGDIVLDPFCGCGTTVAVAQQFRREWIGIDISPIAIKIVKRRLSGVGAAAVNVVGIKLTESELRELGPYGFQNAIIEWVLGEHSPRKSHDMGIDGRSFFYRYPIQVKKRERVGRNDVDNFETAIARDGSDRGYLVAFGFTADAVEEAARTRDTEGVPDVVLVKVATIVQTGELLDAGADVELVAPDLMGLFSGHKRGARERRIASGLPPGAKPSGDELIRSARRGVDDDES